MLNVGELREDLGRFEDGTSCGAWIRSNSRSYEYQRSKIRVQNCRGHDSDDGCTDTRGVRMMKAELEKAAAGGEARHGLTGLQHEKICESLFSHLTRRDCPPLDTLACSYTFTLRLSHSYAHALASPHSDCESYRQLLSVRLRAGVDISVTADGSDSTTSVIQNPRVGTDVKLRSLCAFCLFPISTLASLTFLAERSDQRVVVTADPSICRPGQTHTNEHPDSSSLPHSPPS